MEDVCDAIIFGNHRGAYENVLVELVDKEDVKFTLFLSHNTGQTGGESTRQNEGSMLLVPYILAVACAANRWLLLLKPVHRTEASSLFSRVGRIISSGCLYT